MPAYHSLLTGNASGRLSVIAIALNLLLQDRHRYMRGVQWSGEDKCLIQDQAMIDNIRPQLSISGRYQ